MKIALSSAMAVVCLFLPVGIARADILGQRPSLNDYTNAVDMGTWCGKAVQERDLARGNTGTFLPRTASQQVLLMNVKR